MWQFKKEFVLASASPRRVELLKNVQVFPKEIHPVDIDEMPLKNELPACYVLRMAREKACACAKDFPDKYILAADTIVCVGKRILRKPSSEEEARDQLKLLSGRKHDVLTAIALIRPDQKPCLKRVRTKVFFKKLDTQDINILIASEEWKDAAGSYKIQGMASGFIRQLIGSYSNVVGLPLSETLALLRGNLY